MPTATTLGKAPNWQKALQKAADPARVRHYLEEFARSTSAPELKKASAEQCRLLAALFSGSSALSDLLVAHLDWLPVCLNVESLQYPRHEQGLRREVNQWLRPALQAAQYDSILASLRQFKQREMLRIAIRDLARLGETPLIIREISDLADVCLSAVLQVCSAQLFERYGTPWHQGPDDRWQKTEFTVLGLGKLGGQELNYSSDVDVIFVYNDEGFVFKEMPRSTTPTERAMTSHQYFKRLAEAFIAEVSRPAPEGMLYRIDLRLRPEGDAGPLVRSLESYENFYAQWGQTWERMMLIKARGVAGDVSLAHEFIESVHSFRYPRSLSQGFLHEIAAMKDRIEAEVVRSGELDRNVKLGRGGIREIEFVAQTQQILHAGRIPFLQGAQTLPALDKLAQYNLLSLAEARELAHAYCFLRDVEHRLQMEQNLQTHTIPADKKSRERLAALMGFDSLKKFETALTLHTSKVRSVYDKLLKAETPATQNRFPRDFQAAAAEWTRILSEHGFREPQKALRMLNEFAHGPGYVHVSPRTVELAWQLIPKILALCPGPTRDSLARPAGGTRSQPPVLSDPDRVLTRLDTFITAYGTRAMLFDAWAQNPPFFVMILLLFDRSEFLAEIAIRNPDLLDGLVVSGRLRRRKTAEEILDELRKGRGDEDQLLWIRKYHQAEFMRIGLRDILGLADFEQNMSELTALADACLQYSLEVALRKHKLKSAPMLIVGLGKLGGQELNYGSDLDIIFVAASGFQKLPALQKVAVSIRELLSANTELGVAFATDARLRPDGEKGLLVNTIDAYEEYYRRRAQLWEIQALSRSRPIAGDHALAGQFRHLVASVTDFTPANVTAAFQKPSASTPAKAKAARPRTSRAMSGLSAYTPEWKQAIAHMRARIEKERTPAGQDALAIKTGSGGLVDAEFIAQALCLAHGWHEPNTLRALERARDTGALEPQAAENLIANFRHLLRVEVILRRWSFVGEAVLPVDPAPFYRVSRRCGFSTPEEFRAAIAGYRKAIREVYNKVFAFSGLIFR